MNVQLVGNSSFIIFMVTLIQLASFQLKFETQKDELLSQYTEDHTSFRNSVLTLNSRQSYRRDNESMKFMGPLNDVPSSEILADDEMALFAQLTRPLRVRS